MKKIIIIIVPVILIILFLVLLFALGSNGEEKTNELENYDTAISYDDLENRYNNDMTMMAKIT